MKNIKFRGKNAENGKWVYGFYFQLNGCEYIIEEGTGYFDISHGEPIFATAYCHEIEGGTAGQYVGLKDKNSKEIYEGDILKYNFHGKEEVDYIISEGSMFTYSNTIRWSLYEDEIIGNIHDNTQLLDSK